MIKGLNDDEDEDTAIYRGGVEKLARRTAIISGLENLQIANINGQLFILKPGGDKDSMQDWV